MDTSFEITAVVFEPRLMSDMCTAMVVPHVFARAEKAVLLIGSLELDGHELVPSCRLALQPGEQEYELPAMKLIFPKGAGLPPERTYRFTLRVLAPDHEEIVFEEEKKLI